MNQKISTIFLAVLCAFQTHCMAQNTASSNQNSLELGSIVSIKKVNFKTAQNTTALPKYSQKIRVQYGITTFDKKTFKKYSQAVQKQGRKIAIKYVDSAKTKPTYLNFSLIDKVQLISQLNGQHNTEVSTYLQNTKDHQLMMGISTYLEASQLKLLKQADELYLVNDKPQKYMLSLVKNGKEIAQLDLTKSIIFDYTSAGFCWKKERGKIILANLKSEGESCIKGTHQNIAKLHKKIDYYKF